MSNKYESFRMSHKHVPAYFPGDRIAMFPIFSEIFRKYSFSLYLRMKWVIYSNESSIDFVISHQWMTRVSGSIFLLIKKLDLR